MQHIVMNGDGAGCLCSLQYMNETGKAMKECRLQVVASGVWAAGLELQAMFQRQNHQQYRLFGACGYLSLHMCSKAQLSL